MNYLKVLSDLYGAKSNVKKSAAQIKKMQQKRLRRMLKFAYEHSAYYRRMFNISGITGKPGYMDYQFVQLGQSTFEMRAQVAAEDSRFDIREEIVDRMKKVLDEKKLEFVQFCVKFVNEITPDIKTGKKRLIIGTSGYEARRTV